MEKERENGKGILFGVLGIMTLIIAILGASLAYFTATDRSDEDAVEVQAATVSIIYDQGDIINAGNLIPAKKDVVDYAYAKEGASQCLDANNKPVCAVFEFHATNSSQNQSVPLVGKIITTTTGNPTTCKVNSEDTETVQCEFENLKYVVYDTTNSENVKQIGSPITFARTYDTNNYSSLFNDGLGNDTIIIDGGQTRTFEILIWLNEKSTDITQDNGEGNQNYEQGLKYTGTVEISVSGENDVITGAK